MAPSTWTPSLSWETSALWLRVAPTSDNTSAVAYLRNQGGGHQIARNERLATELCLWSEKRGMTLVPCYLLGHLKVLADHLSRRGQILKTDWSLNQTVADRFFRAWGRPFVDLFALGKNTKLAIYVSPIREETSWKVDNLVPNWNGLYAYAYPPTSLLRACLIKVKTENVEIVLIAPGWPNQEEFPDLRFRSPVKLSKNSHQCRNCSSRASHANGESCHVKH